MTDEYSYEVEIYLRTSAGVMEQVKIKLFCDDQKQADDIITRITEGVIRSQNVDITDRDYADTVQTAHGKAYIHFGEVTFAHVVRKRKREITMP